MLAALGLRGPGRVDAVVGRVVAALAARDEPVTLVLDDFHEVTDPAVAEDLQSLVEHAPPALRLVICTRYDLELRLQRLRVSGHLTEVRSGDLAFTVEETQELGRALGLPLTMGDLELLCQRTEGWAVGLRLAALSLAGQPDPHAFVERFAGDDRALSDYLLSEVISRQPPQALAFLLRTCVVERLTGGLADALVGEPGGAATLATLARRDGLAVALDAHGTWFRYHPLLLEALRIELRRTLPGEIRSLHRRAARWLERHGQALEAIDHAIEGADWELVADAVGRHWLAMVVRGQGARLRELLDRVPGDVVRADAELAVAVAGLRFDANDTASGSELLTRAAGLASRLPEDRRVRLAVPWAVTRLHHARLCGDVEAALSAARPLLGERRDHGLAPDVRAFALVSLGVAELWAEHVALAGSHLQEAAGLARDCDNDYVLLAAEAWASAAALRCEQLDEARRRATAAVGLAEPAGWGQSAAAGLAYVVLGALNLLADDLPAGEAMVARAKAAVGPGGDRLLVAARAQLEAALLSARGEPLAALDVLRGATGGAPPGGFPTRCASPRRCSRRSCCWRSASRPGRGRSWPGRMRPSRRRTPAWASPG